MLAKSLIGAVAVLMIAVLPAAADPDNSNTLTRTLQCDNGRTVDAVFAGEAGSNFNVTVDESVFVYKSLVVDRPPIGPGGNDTVDVRGLQGLSVSEHELVTCEYVTPSGNHVTAIGFFTPLGP
jgi:hypothetical protein